MKAEAEGEDDAVPGLLKITFNSAGAANAGTGEFTSDTVGMPDDDPVVKPNAKQTDVGGDFPHLFDISSGGARVLVFTDKEQETPGVEPVTAVTVVNVAVDGGDAKVESVGEFSDGETSFPGSFDHDAENADTPAIEGTFTCADSPLLTGLYGQRGRCHGHGGDRLHVFRKQGRRYGCDCCCEGRLPPLRCLVG